MSSNLAKRGVNHQMQTASDAHFKKNQKGQIEDILKDKFGLF